jgi:hypothetical protein
MPYSLLFIIIFGVSIRIYLLCVMPVWFDEYLTLKIVNNPLGLIGSGSLDPTHPPGYYLFVKLLNIISTNIYFLRLSTIVFYIINSIFLYKLGLRTKITNYGLILVLLYSLSGYFIVFDWQLRGYTILLTLILASSYLLYGHRDNLHKLLFIIISILGLLFDYGYIFYFIPLFTIEYLKILQKRKSGDWLIPFVASFVVYIFLWGKTFNNFFVYGLNGVKWISRFTAPSFFVPYFLGSYQNQILTCFMLIILVFGLYLIFKKHLKIQIGFVHISLISLIVCILIGIFVSPILHVRSLQVVGLTVLLLQSVTMCYFLKIHKYIAYGLVGVFVINFIGILVRLPKFPSEFLISFVRP